MRARALILTLVAGLCMLALLPALFYVRVSEQSSGGVAVQVVHDSGAVVPPISVGVILPGAAAESGWTETLSGGVEFAETTLVGNRVILFDQFNATYHPGLTLEWTVERMLDRGAQVIFVAPAAAGDADAMQLTERYPGTVFVLNLATRDNVQRLLAVLPSVVSDADSAGQFDGVREFGSEVVSVEDESASGFVFGLILMLVLTVVALGALLLRRRDRTRPVPVAPEPRKRKRRPPGSGYHTRALELETAAMQRRTDFIGQGRGIPLLQELSTYVIGDQHFDEAFPVELADGTYLGECGLQPAAPVNRYDPEKITALELWLFDRRGVETASAVLASTHAAESASIREQLAQQGPVHAIDRDTALVLETSTLRLEARVLSGGYGFADTLPVNSFLDHVVVEIAIFEKEA